MTQPCSIRNYKGQTRLWSAARKCNTWLYIQSNEYPSRARDVGTATICHHCCSKVEHGGGAHPWWLHQPCANNQWPNVAFLLAGWYQKSHQYSTAQDRSTHLLHSPWTASCYLDENASNVGPERRMDHSELNWSALLLSPNNASRGLSLLPGVDSW